MRVHQSSMKSTFVFSAITFFFPIIVLRLDFTFIKIINNSELNYWSMISINNDLMKISYPVLEMLDGLLCKFQCTHFLMILIVSCVTQILWAEVKVPSLCRFDDIAIIKIEGPYKTNLLSGFTVDAHQTQTKTHYTSHQDYSWQNNSDKILSSYEPSWGDCRLSTVYCEKKWKGIK